MDLLRRGLAALVGAAVLELAGLPAGALIGAAVGAGLVASRREVVNPLPAPARLAAFAVLGWLLGSRVDAEALAAIPGLAGPIAVTLGVYGAGAVVTTLALVRWADWPAPTALLAAAPGGVAEMIAIGVVESDTAERVAALHLLRLAMILVVVPPIAVVLD